MKPPLSGFAILNLEYSTSVLTASALITAKQLLQWPMNLISVFCVSRIYYEDCTWNNSRVTVFSFFFNLLDPAPAVFNALVSHSQLLSTDIGGERTDDFIV